MKVLFFDRLLEVNRIESLEMRPGVWNVLMDHYLD